MKLFMFFLLALLVNAECPMSKFNYGSKTEADCPHMKLRASAAAQVTDKGCTCKSLCGASVSDAYDCDWCYTTNSCGRSGLSGSWDWCVYPANKTYEYQSWQNKRDYLWSQIDADHTSGTNNNVLSVLTESVQTTFDVYSDFMPASRKKLIHAIGAVCKFNMQVSENSPFTGVWKAGNVAHGLVRMGSAIAVDLKSGVVPGLGIKFLRSRVPSGNFVALYSLAPLPNNSYNFMERTFSNHIPAATGVAAFLAKKFFQKSQCVTQVGLSDICKYDNDGASAGNVVFPYQVTLDSRIVQFPSSPITQNDLQSQLTSIPPGTALFEVGYYSDPKSAASGAKPTVLGTMVTEGPCVNSAFGDASLFFRHQIIEEDWKLQPTWPGYLSPSKDCSSSASSLSPTPPFQCPARTMFSEELKEDVAVEAL